MARRKTNIVNPNLFSRIQDNVSRIMESHPDSHIQEWQLFEMVAVIESGHATDIAYNGDGLVCYGWNGYRNMENPHTDPYKAWNGFFRMEKGKMAGTMLNLAKLMFEDGKPEDQITDFLYSYSCRVGVHSYWIFETNSDMLWGYKAYRDYYTMADAEDGRAVEQQKDGFKRAKVVYSDVTGMYRLCIETSRKPAGFKRFERARIAQI